MHLYDLHRNDLRLRLPTGRHPGCPPDSLCLRPHLPMRPGLHLRQVLIRTAPSASPMAGCRQPPAPDGLRLRFNVRGSPGRWFPGLTQGRLTHAEIQASSPREGETGAGWAFHFLFGGGGVALIYSAVLLLLGLPSPSHPIWSGVVFGLGTSVLPWFVLPPAFGWGWFGRRGPRGANAWLASPLSHISCGFGVGAIMALGA